MSAFIVSNKTITAIVTAMQHKRFSTDLINPKTGEVINARTNPQKYGQILLDENYRSVNFRYDENRKPHTFYMEYKKREGGYRDEFTLGEMYGSIQCYMYQTCETPDWDGSDIYYAMLSLKDDIAKRMAEKLGDEIKWGL